MPTKSPKENEDPVIQRLDTLIRLQARLAVAHLKTQKDKIIFLGEAGLGPKAIGEILGISSNNANVTLVQARKKKQSGGKKGEEESTDGAE